MLLGGGGVNPGYVGLKHHGRSLSSCYCPPSPSISLTFSGSGGGVRGHWTADWRCLVPGVHRRRSFYMAAVSIWTYSCRTPACRDNRLPRQRIPLLPSQIPILTLQIPLLPLQILLPTQILLHDKYLYYHYKYFYHHRYLPLLVKSILLLSQQMLSHFTCRYYDLWCVQVPVWRWGVFSYLCEDVVCLAEDPAGVGVRGDQQL